MKRIIASVVYATLFTGMLYGLMQIPSGEHTNVTYNVGKVVALGQCKDNECSYQYTDKNNELKYGSTDKPVSLGQLVYQECWYEEAKGNRCYVNYEPSQN
jgi:hypothetical protein